MLTRLMPCRTRLVMVTLSGLIGTLPLPAASSTLEQAGQMLGATTGQAVRPYSLQDFGREQYKSARSILIPEDSAEATLKQVRAKLPKGAIAFIGNTNNLRDGKTERVELVVAEGSSQFDILRVAASDGINYNLATEDLIRELKAWDREFGIDIWHAETDTIELRLKTMPKDLKSFAKRLYKFCPDIVDQGVGSVEALEKEIAARKAVYLWWD